jgi:hypothetical protein
MNISYIPQLTDEVTEEYNSDEYMTRYSSVLRNIQIYSSVTRNQGIYLRHPPPRALRPRVHINQGI